MKKNNFHILSVLSNPPHPGCDYGVLGALRRVSLPTQVLMFQDGISFWVIQSNP